jgi:hypothetical protein
MSVEKLANDEELVGSFLWEYETFLGHFQRFQLCLALGENYRIYRSDLVLHLVEEIVKQWSPIYLKCKDGRAQSKHTIFMILIV